MSVPPTLWHLGEEGKFQICSASQGCGKGAQVPTAPCYSPCCQTLSVRGQLLLFFQAPVSHLVLSRCSHSFPRAALTSYNQLGGLKQHKFISLTVLNPESSSMGSSESRHLWILGENHSLMWTVTLIHLSSWPLFPMCLCISLCSLIKTPVVELRAHPSPVWPHFNLHPNYICKDCLFKYDVTLGKTLFNPGQ